MQKNNDTLKVIVLTQSDKFFIPQNIYKASKVCNLLEVVQVDCKHSLNNKLKDYFEWFGLLQCAKMGVKTIIRIIQNMLDKLFGYKLYNGFCAVSSVAKAMDVDYRIINDSNSAEFIEHIIKLAPDLIISYSAPQVIKKELLNIPKHGIINVHGSLLPNYRGCLPSFWYLYNEEKVGGATVHYMSEKIDDGAIIKQGSVDISNCKTMFMLMEKTKKLGGELMTSAILDIQNGQVEMLENDTTKGGYYTWPTKAQAKEFLKKGYKLI